MKASKLRELSDDELIVRLKDTRKELFNLRFQHATGQLDNPHKLNATRREIARLLTMQSERERTRKGHARQDAQDPEEPAATRRCHGPGSPTTMRLRASASARRNAERDQTMRRHGGYIGAIVTDAARAGAYESGQRF